MTKRGLDWKPGSLKPTEPKVYRVQVESVAGFRYWNGDYWGPLSSTVEEAELSQGKRGGFDTEYWRELPTPKPRSDLPTITHVAIKYQDQIWSLPAPNRHHHVLMTIVEQTGKGVYGPSEEGFLDSTGRFLGRVAAFALASDNHQLKRKPGGYQGRQLFSEDLW